MGKKQVYSEKLLKEKTFAVVPPVDVASPNFAQKVLRIATKLQKFAKVFFSLKIFRYMKVTVVTSYSRSLISLATLVQHQVCVCVCVCLQQKSVYVY